VQAVSASPALDSDDIAYRLAYANPNQARRYSGSEWTATPAQLMTDRLRGKLAQTAQLLEAGDPEDTTLLKVELLDFSQRFDAPGRGQGVVSIRATLKTRTHLIAQRDFTASVPSPTANAEGGASAIAQAADAVLDNLTTWAAQSAAAR
jgi:cholesterol transport system auxiliary component